MTDEMVDDRPIEEKLMSRVKWMKSSATWADVYSLVVLAVAEIIKLRRQVNAQRAELEDFYHGSL